MGTVETPKLETTSSERGCVCYAPLALSPSAGKRIQRKRKLGFKMPSNTVYVGRPTKWGNPYTPNSLLHEWQGFPNDDLVRAECVRLYRNWLIEIKSESPTWFDTWMKPLVGKNLACWCAPDKPCHVDVLLELLSEGYNKSSGA